MTETDEQRRIRERAQIEKKSEDSSVNVVKKVFQQPEVQHVIKVEINKQMFISGLFMAFFLVGFFQIFNVAKVVFAYNWTVDLAIGLILCVIGAIYTAKQVLQK